jgi:hypothetical protein
MCAWCGACSVDVHNWCSLFVNDIGFAANGGPESGAVRSCKSVQKLICGVSVGARASRKGELADELLALAHADGHG